MSEQKALCPWCGREMIASYQPPEDHTYRCLYCRTNSPIRSTPHEAWKAAISRPLRKPLKLEELNECDIFYIEFRDLNEGNFIPVQFSPESHFKGMLTYHRPGWATHFSIEMFGCGRYWRCWRTRPTIEERAAAPWEE